MPRRGKRTLNPALITGLVIAGVVALVFIGLQGGWLKTQVIPPYYTMSSSPPPADQVAAAPTPVYVAPVPSMIGPPLNSPPAPRPVITATATSLPALPRPVLIPTPAPTGLPCGRLGGMAFFSRLLRVIAGQPDPCPPPAGGGGPPQIGPGFTPPLRPAPVNTTSPAPPRPTITAPMATPAVTLLPGPEGPCPECACATASGGPLSFFSRLNRSLRAQVGLQPIVCTIARWCSLDPGARPFCRRGDPPATQLEARDDEYSAVRGVRLRVFSLLIPPRGVLFNDMIPFPLAGADTIGWNADVIARYKVRLVPGMEPNLSVPGDFNLREDGMFEYRPAGMGNTPAVDSFRYKVVEVNPVNGNIVRESNPAKVTINIRPAPQPAPQNDNPWWCVNSALTGNFVTRNYKLSVLTSPPIWQAPMAWPNLPVCKQLAATDVPGGPGTKMPWPWPEHQGAAFPRYEFYWWTPDTRFRDTVAPPAEGYATKVECQEDCRIKSDAAVDHWKDYAARMINGAADRNPPVIWPLTKAWLLQRLQWYAPQLKWVSKSQI